MGYCLKNEKSYAEAAQKIINLANEYSGDYGLETILIAGATRINELAKKEVNLMIKSVEKN